jgi:hypothetical protein
MTSERHVVVHIGMARTGAAVLQRDYFARAEGLLYLGKGGGSDELDEAGRRLAQTSYFKLETEPLRQVFAARIEASEGRPVYSDQDLSSWADVPPKELGTSLGDVFPRPKLLFVIRRPIDWVRSTYYQALAAFDQRALDGPNPWLEAQLRRLEGRSRIGEIQFAKTFEQIRHNARAEDWLILPHELMVHQPREFLARVETLLDAPSALTGIFDRGEPPARNIRINRLQAAYIRTLGYFDQDRARFFQFAQIYGSIGPREHRQSYNDLAASPDAQYKDWERWFRRGRRPINAALEREDEQLLAGLPVFDDYRIRPDLTARVLEVEQAETAALKAQFGVELEPFGYGRPPTGFAAALAAHQAAEPIRAREAEHPQGRARAQEVSAPGVQAGAFPLQPVTLHIGMGSAGVAALQAWFARAKGLNYLGRGGPDRRSNSRLRSLSLLREEQLDLGEMRDQFEAKITSSPSMPVASVETLSTWKGFDPAELGRRTAEVFGPPRVIYVTRRPTTWAVAHYHSRLLALQRDTFAGLNPWLEKHLSQLRVGSDLAAAAFAQTLERFCEGAGAEEVLVLAYEELESDPGAFLARIDEFLSLGGRLAELAGAVSVDLSPPDWTAMNYVRVLSLFERERDQFLAIADILGAGVPTFFRRRFQEVRQNPDATLADWVTWFRNSQKAVARAIAKGDDAMGRAIDIFPDAEPRPGLIAHLSEIEAEATRALAAARKVDLTPYGYLAAAPALASG